MALFGAINGATIHNLSVENVTINVNLSSETNGDTTFAGIAGKAFSGSRIYNCSVKNFIFDDSGLGTQDVGTKLYCVGGIVGKASAQKGTCTVENCFVNANVTSFATTNSGKNGQCYTGGIVGFIRYNAAIPANCVFTGNLKSNFYIAPIVSAIRVKKKNDYATVSGVSQQELTNCFYYNSSFSQSDGTAINTTVNLRKDNDGNYDPLGIEVTDFQNSLSVLNSYVTQKTDCLGWKYSDNNLYLNTFIERADIEAIRNGIEYTLVANIENIENPVSTIWKDENENQISENQNVNVIASSTEKNITLVVTNSNGTTFEKTYKIPAVEAVLNSRLKENITYETFVSLKINSEKVNISEMNGYIFRWNIDDNQTVETTNGILEINAKFLEQKVSLEILKDGNSIITISEIFIPSIDIKIALEQDIDFITATIDGENKGIVTEENYIFQWFRTSDNQKIFEGQKIDTINLEDGETYKIIAKHNSDSQYDLTTSFTYQKDGLNTVIFVNFKKGKDKNDGLTENKPVKTIGKALEIIKSASGIVKKTVDNNKIVIIGKYTDAINYTFDVPVTVTGKHNGKDYSAVLRFKAPEDSGVKLESDVKFEYLTFDGRNDSTTIYCQGNNITMGEGIVMKNYKNFDTNTGIPSNVNMMAFQIIGGFLNYNSEIEYNQPIDKVCNITIKSGTYARILGGNKNTVLNSESNNIFATKEKPFKVNINIDYTNTDKTKFDIGLVCGGQTDGAGHFNSIINVKNGSIARLVGGSIGTNNIATNFFEGNINVNVLNGYIKEFFGASLGIDVTDVTTKGKIEIAVLGGEIDDNLYSCGAATISGSESEPVKVSLNISGGTINGNIYGGGYAYSGTNKQAPAKVYGNIDLKIENSPNIIGNIYGAGLGFEESPDMAMVNGNISIELNSTELNSDIYGGGNNSKVIGDSKIIMTNTNITGNVFGASSGSLAVLQGNTDINIETSEIKGNIFGGGNNGSVNGATKIYANNVTMVSQDTLDSIVNAVDGVTIGASIYGGGNNSNVDNTLVEINSGTIDGDIFGGGNQGAVLENTKVVIGDETSKELTVVGGTVYSGGRNSDNSITTVSGTSTAIISGMQTELTFYGAKELGKVDGDVTIIFNNYYDNSQNQYKKISGINQATHMSLNNSYIELTNGLVDITNLSIPSGSGMLFNNDSEIKGDFSGGGTIFYNTSICLTINGNIKNAGETKLSLNPEYIETSGDIIKSGISEPYIVVKGIDETGGTAFVSGYSDKYKIVFVNKGDVVEEDGVNKIVPDTMYYIEKVELFGDYIEAVGTFAEGKIFNQEIEMIEDTPNIHIMSSDSFTANIEVKYNIFGDLESTTNINKCKNLSRSVLLQNEKVNVNFPIGTNIVMKFNNEYYGITIESSISEIDLNDFTKLESSEKYTQYADLRNLFTKSGNLSTYAEDFRFIVDFSKCESKINVGEYDFVLKVTDGDEGYAISESKNLINILERKFEIKDISLDKNLYERNGKILITGNIEITEKSQFIQKDNEKDISAILHLEDGSGNIIKIPNGTKIKFGEQEYHTSNSGMIINILKNIPDEIVNKKFQIEFDMSGVIQESEMLVKGNYKIVLDLYTSDMLNQENMLITPLTSGTCTFGITNISRFGIKAQIIDDMNSDLLQLVKNGDTRIVQIQNDISDLNDAKIKVLLQKRSGPFSYINMENNITEQEINISNNIENLELKFNNLNEGVYRLVFILSDKNEIEYTFQNMNFIVE